MRRNSLDSVIKRPYAMASYLAHYGWHFNKKAFEYAVKTMKKKDESSGKMTGIDVMDKNAVDELLKRNGIKLENDVLYDAAYVANMIKTDCWKSSIEDERHLALSVKDMIDDYDAADGEIMRCWWAKMVGRGLGAEWEDLL